jgi:bifunctional N-acetylglucosamine-1-phosphate-uridyltransferase/glucosamine-1-phosphate-acetyltransferase GlmU-like protein
LKTPLEYVASVIFAAGKGSRMVGYNGNKTLLPLIPAGSFYEGERPLLLEVLANLPSGPKGIVVNHCAEDVQRAAEGLHASFLHQPVTNGTGGALLAALPFLESASTNTVVITMGDVPLIRPATYERLVKQLDACDLAVLAFEPEDKAQYGVLEVEGERVRRIVEWKYWRSYSSDRQAALRFCNAGVYAARRQPLLHYMGVLAENPHTVQKKWGDRLVAIEEYFITDLVEMMSEDKRSVGMVTAMEEEVAGVDTPEALKQAQSRYASMAGA